MGKHLYTYRGTECHGTAELCMMDKYFDLLNIKNDIEHTTSIKEFLTPYTSPNDKRFKWLINDFLYFPSVNSTIISFLPALEKYNISSSSRWNKGALRPWLINNYVSFPFLVSLTNSASFGNNMNSTWTLWLVRYSKPSEYQTIPNTGQLRIADISEWRTPPSIGHPRVADTPDYIDCWDTAHSNDCYNPFIYIYLPLYSGHLWLADTSP